MPRTESLVVAHPDLAPASTLAPLLRLKGKAGFVVADMTDVDEFAPIPSVVLPDAPRYVLRDVDRGLVDFPSFRDGEEVLLCWQLGEDEIGWWHTLDGGFAGRQPL